MVGVYIHIPFCKKICNYCDFCKVLYNDKYISKYLDNLENEIKTRYKGEKVTSIYIGGGSPSSLKTSDMKRLLQIIKLFKTDKDIEFTTECNPDDLDKEKLELYLEYGINRLSLGVESFNSDILNVLGRVNTKEMIISRIKLAKEYFKNINIDLIYGVNEDIKTVLNDIDLFLELDIPHISCYSLIIEEHTKLYIGGTKYIDSDIDSKIYDSIQDKLSKHGYNHYEISNYALPGYESRHNQLYWHNLEYYGFGLGAVSYLDKVRRSNTKNLSKYLRGEYLDNNHLEDIQEEKENTLILGLRLVKGIKIDEYNRRFNDSILDREVIKELINDGYLENIHGYLRCKKEYLYTENSILERIIGSELC